MAFFEAGAGPGCLDTERGESLSECLGGGCFGTGPAGVIGAETGDELVGDVLKSNYLHG